MSKMRVVARRDPNERAIVEALRDAGALVHKLDARDLPDLLVGYRERWWLLEVKRPLGAKGGGSEDGQRLSEGQASFFASAATRKLPVRVVRTVREALEAIGAHESLRDAAATGG